MRIDVLQAGPRAYTCCTLELPEGATVAMAIAALPGIPSDIAGYAVHGVRVEAHTVLREGDRLELLRGLQADPKEARRRRAAARLTR